MNRALSLLVVLVTLVLQPARAAITLHIDTNAQEIYFSGSDSGTPYTAQGPEYYADWTGPVANGGTDAFLPISLAFSSTQGFITEAYFVFQSEGYYGIAIGLSNNASNTILANSNQRIAYGGIALWTRTIINNLAATPSPLTINPESTGYTDLNVEAVPEPATWMLLALGGAVIACRFLRRRA